MLKMHLVFHCFLLVSNRLSSSLHTFALTSHLSDGGKKNEMGNDTGEEDWIYQLIFWIGYPDTA